MLSLWRRKNRLDSLRGLTLIELLIVVAMLGVLVAIAVPLYANAQARARVEQAQADVRAIAEAIVAYSAHLGVLPTAVTDLTTSQSNPQGIWAGPFLANTIQPPETWDPYTYTDHGDGTFTISSSSLTDNANAVVQFP